MASIMNSNKSIRFNDAYSKLIAKWCIDHLKKFGTVIGDNITTVFHHWAENSATDKATIDQIEDILEFLSNEYSGSADQSPDYILSLATEYFNTRIIKNRIEEAEGSITSGQVDEAYKQLNSTPRIDFSVTSIIKPLEDHEELLEVFNEERVKPLFEYPGDLGKLIGQSFTRGTLFAFMGIEKAGKSYYLLDAAYRALKQRHRVAYFEVGDLGKRKTIERLGQRILRQPVNSEDVSWPIGWDKEDKPTTELIHKDGVSVAHLMKRIRRYTRGRDLLRLSVHTNSSINVTGIESYLQEWARIECWTPDVVVIDYADILAPPSGFMELKDQIDETWKQLRRMSQTYDCLVLTATQTGAQAYKKNGRYITRHDFSGRKTKLAHVNGILGLNASAEDMRRNITRVNWVVRREGGGSESLQVLVAGCFAAGMPIVLSKFPKPFVSPNGQNGKESSEHKGKEKPE
jgi:archaellum biogenesis ATPase FlaH